MTIKLCIDCQWMGSTRTPDDPFCNHPDVPKSLVNGKTETKCQDNRHNAAICGIEGKLFYSREKAEAEKVEAKRKAEAKEAEARAKEKAKAEEKAKEKATTKKKAEVQAKPSVSKRENNEHGYRPK